MSLKSLQIILGLGKTGYSCVQYLAAQQANLLVCDTRANPPCLGQLKQHFPHIPFHSGSFSTELLLQAERIIISPGLSLHDSAIQAAIQHGIPVIGDVELFAQVVTQPIVAITGTNAKGTVTTLVGLMAEKAGINVKLGGNIGTPVLDLLAEERAELYILELSSFQLETTHSLKSIAATILNISMDHLDHHTDMAEYIAAKQRIYQHAQHLVMNRNDAATWPAISTSEQTNWSFGLDAPLDDRQFGCIIHGNEIFLAQGQALLMSASELKIPGAHNRENALAALALGSALQLPLDAMLAALREFTGLAHRCQLVRERNGVCWYNDSKGTNIGATAAALKGFADDKHTQFILLAGGEGKGADFNELRSLVEQFVDEVILFGRDAKQIESSWHGAAEIVLVKDMQEAVQTAAKLAKSSAIVLLSPACASFDMFNNFEHRGEVFIREVQKL